ncbi:hypothetical protein AAFF_G00433030 [Aldrovandia affinis]|uniref:Uncharacterized protein n=1 Tax=Aldrovandia affinis TaxID=143900 RepID=A0AAD7SAW3_9TELE|nr:hypothetical protein AAFF_G00433030 [Aldrovandia affinis]
MVSLEQKTTQMIFHSVLKSHRQQCSRVRLMPLICHSTSDKSQDLSRHTDKPFRVTFSPKCLAGKTGEGRGTLFNLSILFNTILRLVRLNPFPLTVTKALDEMEKTEDTRLNIAQP